MNLKTCVVLCTLTACGPGKGTEKFTTWGEAYLEEGIPAAEFADGWALHYEKFLVVFAGITVADSTGRTGATSSGARLVDNTKPGRKALDTFDDLDAQAWDRVGYEILPAAEGAQLISATEDDRAVMTGGGFSLYVAGAATKGAVTKTFHWGFTTATRYRDCTQPAESGTPIEGVVVTVGGTDTSELTTHGDHLYYDRLKASPDSSLPTSLRFDEKAAADANGDGEITLDELDAAPLDVTKYDPSGFDAPTLGAFMKSLARTVGHFRGEGECALSRVE